jgi:DNA repair protein SbcC/Rad50
MKLAQLQLPAFGPFTEKVIDFAGAATNLHLIYGPNEAGKSSALRAMTDLRFGIPARSPDDFVHPYERMRIAGVFVDPHGSLVGFSRRKGRSPTLSRFNPLAGMNDAVTAATPAEEQALAGGLDRAAFESMFGLDHERLRKGGELLLEGHGELGAALFEASAGTQGIAKLLAALDEDAKKYYNPHGRTTTATINEARRTLDEARQGLRQALTRPTDWQTLHRAHESALSKLTEVTAALGALRQLDHELTELRTVEPLLREYDHASAELAVLADVPVLRDTAHEERLAAQQALARAIADAEEASLTIDRLTASLDGVIVEKTLLAHGATIERVAKLIDASARDRQVADREKDAAARIASELALLATRLVPGGDLQAILAAVPSAADRIALEQHLAMLASLAERSHEPRKRAEELRAALAVSDQPEPALPETAARRALQSALRRANALGDIGRQIDDVERQIKTHEADLQRLLAVLHVDDADRLVAARPLLDAQIQQMRQSNANNASAMLEKRNELSNLLQDLQARRLELLALQATGEVVTAETLRTARSHRDQAWLAIRHAYTEGNWSPAGRLIAAYEAAQREADRQADLLRTDAERAAKLTLTQGRIEQMQGRQVVLQQALTELELLQRNLDREWKAELTKNALPEFDPETLKEWQTRRMEGLQVIEQLTTARLKHKQMLHVVAEAANEISLQLQAVGVRLGDSRDALGRLRGAIEEAEQWEISASKAAADKLAQMTLEEKDRIDLARAEAVIADADAQAKFHRQALQRSFRRLFLDEAATPEAIRARVDELEAIARKAVQMAEAHSRERELRAGIEDLDRQVGGLCELIGEPLPILVEDFAERLRTRLELARKAERERETLTRGLAESKARQCASADQRTMCEATLERLCREAGGVAIAELPVCEARARQKIELTKHCAKLHRQLIEASSGNVDALRERLAGRAVASLEAERENIKTEITRHEAAVAEARRIEEQARRALEAIDTSDAAATARESMEAAAARMRSAVRPWARLRLAHALLREALNRFRERAQAPMIAAASTYFSLMTGGAFTRLVADEVADKPVLRAERRGGAPIGVEAMSEGTRDQLYLALRLAALELRRGSHPDLPLVLDDVLITSDDERATHILRALERFSVASQVVIFTHHRHLIDVARRALPESACAIHEL